MLDFIFLNKMEKRVKAKGELVTLKACTAGQIDSAFRGKKMLEQFNSGLNYFFLTLEVIKTWKKNPKNGDYIIYILINNGSWNALQRLGQIFDNYKEGTINVASDHVFHSGHSISL